MLRAYAALLAGINRMRWRKFLAYNAAGAIVWAAAYTAASYAAGNAVTKASEPVAAALGAVTVIVIVTALLVAHRQSGSLADRAEAAYPGPLHDR